MVAGVRGRGTRRAVVALAVLAGCSSSTVFWVADRYYDVGPEAVLADLESLPVRSEGRCIAAMERAMALLELGRYEQVDEAFAPCDAATDQVAVEPGFYRGEPHERVYREVVRTAAWLALQNGESAARGGRGIVTAIEASGCEACRFPMARWVAALALEAGGRRLEAVTALVDARSESPASAFLVEELERQWRWLEPVSGFAPPPGGTSPTRELVVVLLLGPGPAKIPREESEGGRGARLIPAYRSSIAGTRRAQVVIDGRAPEPATMLADIGELARLSLEARRQSRPVESEIGAAWITGYGGMDLRHWGSLPAVGLAVRVAVPLGSETVTIAYSDAFGFKAGSESFGVPPEWRADPIYVVRRVP